MKNRREILKGLRGLVSSGVGKNIQLWAAVALLYFVLKVGEKFVTSTAYKHFFGAENTTSDATIFTMVIGIPWALKVVFGPFLDRFGSRMTWVTVSTVLSVLLTLAMGIGTSGGLVLMGTIAVLQTLAAAMQDTVMDAIVIEQFDEKKRWLVLVAVKLVNIAGALIGGSLAWNMVKADASAWLVTCFLMVLVMGVASAAGLPLLKWGMKVLEKVSDNPVKKEKFRVSLKKLIQRVREDDALKSFFAFSVLCLLWCICAGGTVPIQANWFSWLVDDEGLGFSTFNEKAEAMDAILKWGSVVVAGLMASRIGVKPVLAIAILITAVGYSSIGLTANAWTETGLLISVALATVGDGAFQFTMWLAAMSFADRYGYKATVFALLMTFMNVSELIWKAVGGWLAQVDWLPHFLSNEALCPELHQRGHEFFVKTGVDWNLGLFVVMGGLVLLALIPLRYVRFPKKEVKD